MGTIGTPDTALSGTPNMALYGTPEMVLGATLPPRALCGVVCGVRRRCVRSE